MLINFHEIFVFQDESDSSNRTNRSSFGLLPKELLEATQSTGDETFEWTMSKSMLKKPPMLQKTSSKKDVISPKDSISIGDQYLKPTLERWTNEEADETTPLDLLLGSTIGTYNLLISFMIMIHTIREVKFFPEFFPRIFFLTIFLVKSKLSTAKKPKTTTLSRVFNNKKVYNFFREIKVVNS